jgi:hypothetical protein
MYRIRIAPEVDGFNADRSAAGIKSMRLVQTIDMAVSKTEHCRKKNA